MLFFPMVQTSQDALSSSHHCTIVTISSVSSRVLAGVDNLRDVVCPIIPGWQHTAAQTRLCLRSFVVGVNPLPDTYKLPGGPTTEVKSLVYTTLSGAINTMDAAFCCVTFCLSLAGLSKLMN